MENQLLIANLHNESEQARIQADKNQSRREGHTEWVHQDGVIRKGQPWGILEQALLSFGGSLIPVAIKSANTYELRHGKPTTASGSQIAKLSAQP